MPASKWGAGLRGSSAGKRSILSSLIPQEGDRMNYPETLLVCDGSPHMLAVAFILQSGGCPLIMAPDVRTALEELNNYQFELVILRCPRGEPAPLKLLKELKRKGSATKILVVGEHQGRPLAPEALEMEVADYLLLPCRPQLLCRRVAACLSSRQGRAAEPEPGQVSSPTIPGSGPLTSSGGSLWSLAGELMLLGTGAFGKVAPGAAQRARLLAVRAAMLMQRPPCRQVRRKPVRPPKRPAILDLLMAGAPAAPPTGEHPAAPAG